MYVVATAGHVDHGKSTLVRALTGIEPDRWEAERRRGLTIDLGYAWATLPGVGELAFVDVPGHRRFIGNMLAGLGPAPAVLLVVAADAGWSAQTEEHLLAVDALGLRHGLVAVTRADLVDPDRAEEVRLDAVDRLARTTLGEGGSGVSPGAGPVVDSVVVSAVDGRGLDDVRRLLGLLCARLPAPRVDGRLRLWVDRSFTITGSGTVVTGTLGAGTLSAGDQVEVKGRRLGVRRLQALDSPRESVAAVARVAVNLRGVEAHQVRRGDALLTPGMWRSTGEVDVRLAVDAARLPRRVQCHVGTAAVEARVRPLAGAAARLVLERPLPLEAGDRLILRDPGHEGAITGASVADPAPPPLRRRGDGARRGAEVAATGDVTLVDEVRRRGVLSADEARLHGHDPDAMTDADLSSAGIARVARHLATEAQVGEWRRRLVDAVEARAVAEPLEPTLPMAAARDAAGLPDLASLEQLCAATGLVVEGGRVGRPGARPSLGAKQAGLDAICAGLVEQPFAAPERPDLDAAGLGPREIAAAVATGQLIRLKDGVLLLPTAPALAMRVLAGLPQPFTTSEARVALGTTRRVAIPLLEHLDGRGWTRRVDTGHREVVR